MKKLMAALTLIGAFFFAIPTFAFSVEKVDTLTEFASENDISLQGSAVANPQFQEYDLIFGGQTVNTDRPINSTEPKLKESQLTEVIFSEDEIDLLARLVRAEAQTEPFEGKIAVACVVLNRVKSSQFPNTITDVIYEPGQFQPVRNREINKPADEESINAVYAALSDERGMAHDSLFFYNPDIASSRWLDSRDTTVVIGNHVFKK